MPQHGIARSEATKLPLPRLKPVQPGGNDTATFRGRIAVDRRRKLQSWRKFWSLVCSKGTLKAAIIAVLFALILMFDVSRVAAQGCSMCYQDAAASGAAGRAALRHGILVLLLPAISLFLAMLALIYLRRAATR